MENLRAELSWGTAHSLKGDLIKENNWENTCSLQHSGNDKDRMCVGQAWWLITYNSILKRLGCSEIEASLSSIVCLRKYKQPGGLSPQTNKNTGFGVYRTDNRDVEALRSESPTIFIVCAVFLLASTSIGYSLKLGRCLDSVLTNVQLLVYLFLSGQNCRKKAVTTSINLIRTSVMWRGWNIISNPMPKLTHYFSPLSPATYCPPLPWLLQTQKCLQTASGIYSRDSPALQ